MGISNPQAFSPAGSEITLSLLRNDFAFPVWSENSGFGCSRNVLWPGELGSSSFSPERHQMNGLGGRACKFQRHVAQSKLHIAINIVHILLIVKVNRFFYVWAQKFSVWDSYAWVSANLFLVTFAHSPGHISRRICRGTFQGADFCALAEVLGGGMGASQTWNWGWMSLQ